MENRVPGGDVNPYLASAAAIAAGLYGIENEALAWEPAFTGNAYAAGTGAGKLPKPCRRPCATRPSCPGAEELPGPRGRSETRLWTTTPTWPGSSWPRSTPRLPTGSGSGGSSGCERRTRGCSAAADIGDGTFAARAEKRTIKRYESGGSKRRGRAGRCVAVRGPSTRRPSRWSRPSPRLGLGRRRTPPSSAPRPYPRWRPVDPADRAVLRGVRRAGTPNGRTWPAWRRQRRQADRRRPRRERHGVETFRYYAGAPERLLGRHIPVAGGVDMTFREPLGVVGLIVPWNFPLVDRLLEGRAGAGGRQHGGAQAGRADAADRPAAGGDRRRPACRRASSMWSPGRAACAGSGWSSTPTSPRSPSPGRPRSGAGSPRGRRHDQAGDARARRQVGQRGLRRRRPGGGRGRGAVAVFGNAGQDCCARSRILVERRRWTTSSTLLEPAVTRAAGGRPARRGDPDGPADLGRPARDRGLLRARRRAGGHPRRAPDGPGFWFPPTVLAPVGQRRPGRRRGDLRPGRVRDPVRRRGRRGAHGQRHDLRPVGLDLDRDGARALRVARAVDSGVLSINSNTSVRVDDAVRRLQAVRSRPRARARTRSSTTPRSRTCTTRPEED